MHTSKEIDELRKSLLAVAIEIGKWICDVTVWTNDRELCYWCEPQITGTRTDDRHSNVPSGDIYSGSAGIALFLLELYRKTTYPIFRNTAIGALKYSLDWSSRLKATPQELSFYLGRSGVAYTVYNALYRFGEHEFTLDCSGIIESLIYSSQHASGLRQYIDLLTGNAGTILALLALSQYPKAIETAYELGLDICSRADWTEGIATWDVEEASGFDPSSVNGPLAGLSHGVSGIALALMKLFSATADRELLLTARGAYAYEDTLFDDEQANWLDLRLAHSVDKARVSRSSLVAWCHGAAGILLSRLIAAQCDPEMAEYHVTRAKLAAKTTFGVLRQSLNGRIHDYGLCHGIGGLLEILNLAHSSFHKTISSEIIVSPLEVLLNTTSGSIFCTNILKNSISTSLMNGRVGVGHTLLRILDPVGVSSVLLVTR